MNFMLDINNRYGLEAIQFPDGQYHVRLHEGLLNRDGHQTDVRCAIKSPTDLYLLMATSNALDNAFIKKGTLTIPYLMGARSDRVMLEGDSVGLKVVAQMINHCGFEKVILFDVHSDVALQLINKSVNVNNRSLVEAYDKKDAVLICPDAGAAKKIDSYLEWNPNITDVVHCVKSRDLKTGAITLRVLSPLACSEEHCVIIDDLCDGGGTFLAVSDQIKFPQSMTLIVSHGIFSKGLAVFKGKFDKIITTNSYQKQTQSELLETKELPL